MARGLSGGAGRGGGRGLCNDELYSLSGNHSLQKPSARLHDATRLRDDLTSCRKSAAKNPGAGSQRSALRHSSRCDQVEPLVGRQRVRTRVGGLPTNEAPFAARWPGWPCGPGRVGSRVGGSPEIAGCGHGGPRWAAVGPVGLVCLHHCWENVPLARWVPAPARRQSHGSHYEPFFELPAVTFPTSVMAV